MEFYASHNSLLLLALAKSSGRVYGASRLPLLAVVAGHDKLLGASRFYFLDDLDYLYYGGAIELERKKGEKSEFTEAVLTKTGEKMLSTRLPALFSAQEQADIREVAASRAERNLFALFEEAFLFEPVQAGALSDLRAKFSQLAEACYVVLQLVYAEKDGDERRQEWLLSACDYVVKVLSWAADERWEPEKEVVLANVADFLATVLVIGKYRCTPVFDECFNFVKYYAKKNGFKEEFEPDPKKVKRKEIKPSEFW